MKYKHSITDPETLVVDSVAGGSFSGQHPATPKGGHFDFGCTMGGMKFHVNAVYENGVLRPLQPLDLKEHEHVIVSVVKDGTQGRSSLAVEYIEKTKRELQAAQPALGLEEVRKRLAKIPGSMAAEIIAERGDR